ncbi:CopL family metal-binding regulatory protein [Nevskia sp.]|uniref:CopL family metal-binding regulatory protein n=1 Tax=Nevskia sp. TaxID=1929292 RepID=UPI0025E6A2FC|nr:CopL family metal-binding regulatory protein [Nevskia sp.]
MTRRLALSLLTVLALLWQGAASAAMGAAMVLPPPAIESAAEMPCHDMAGMDEADGDHRLTQDCCGSGSHCVCAAACGTAALPGTGFTLNLLPSPDVKARAIIAVLRDTAPPHPFRPPIVSAV